ncbi:MAG: hypothetical protein M3R05_01245 [Chloroflexota bacterium]|nr:hypothetical protein [Chloroflexota bacterium]
MPTRILLIFGFLASIVERGLGFIHGRILRGRRTWIVVGLLVAAATIPIFASFRGSHPQEVTVGEILAGKASRPDGWVRVPGTIESLLGIPSDVEGTMYLLHDAKDPSLSIVLRSGTRLQRLPEAPTGHLEVAAIQIPGYASATDPAAGSQRRVIPGQLLALDATPAPRASIAWPLVLLPLVVGAILFVGNHFGYPLYEETREIDVLATPLAPGERLPVVVAGRVGEHRSPLHDPVEGLLLVSAGSRGPELAVQLLLGGGRHVAPEAVGEWTAGTVGYVHTMREHVAAIALQAEQIDAILMFASIAERDRAAGRVSIRR